MSASSTSVLKYWKLENSTKFEHCDGTEIQKKEFSGPHDFDRPFYPDDKTLSHLANMEPKAAEGWILWKAVQNKKDRYFGAAFWHEKNQQLVISHRGTIIPSAKKIIGAEGIKNKFKTFIAEFNDFIGTVKADIKGVINCEYTDQVHSACSFAYWVLENFPVRPFTLSITGHSLGAWLASITAFTVKYLTVNEDHFRYLNKKERESHLYHPHTVTFDSPGCYNMLCKISKDFFHTHEDQPHDLISALDITTYFIQPNSINCKNEHGGRLIRLDFELPVKGFFQNLFHHNIKFHYMEHFIETLGQNPHEVSKSEIFNWPKFRIKETFLQKIKNLFGSSGKTSYETVLHIDQTDLDNLNQDSILVPYEEGAYDETFVLTNIFRGDEIIFLKSWMELKKHKPNLVELNNFFSKNGNKIRIFSENKEKISINFDSFLPDFEISDSEHKLHLKPQERDNIGKLKNVVNRAKWLILLFPTVKQAMRDQILATPTIFEAVYRIQMYHYIESLPKYKVSFKDRIQLEEFIKKNYQILHLRTKTTKDETLRVYDILQRIQDYKGKFCVFGVNDIHYLDQWVDTAGVFGSQYSDIDKLLVINFDDSTDFAIINKFYDKITQNIKKKIILISQKTIENEELRDKVHEKDVEDVGLTDLSDQSMNELLDQGIVSFNGWEFKLKDFIKTNKLDIVSKTLQFTTLTEFLTKRQTIEFNFENDIFDKIYFNLTTVKVLKDIQIGSLKEIVENYRSTPEKKNVEILITSGNQIPLLSEFPQITIHNSTDQEESSKFFYEFCRKNPDKTIFRLHKENNEYDQLKWLDVFDTDLYMKRKFSENFPILSGLEFNEEELISRNDKVVLISNTAGMGKSTTLFHLYKNVTNSWSFWINLIEAHEYVSKKIVDIDNVVKFLLKTNNHSSALAEVLLKFCLTNENSLPIYLFIDAFDEIQDSKNKKKDVIRHEILEILKFLNEKTFAKIFISTRTYDCKTLEQELKTKSVKLQELDKKQQIEFCTKFWESKTSLNTYSENPDFLSTQAKQLLSRITESIGENTLSFLGIPLQLRMIVEIFEPSKIQEIRVLNLYDLYSQFIDRKYEIFFDEKTYFTAEFFRKLLKPQLQENHKILGMAHLFPDLSPKIDYGNLAFLNGIGLVQINNGTISFIHRTFAEYFAAELFVYWMENNPEKNIKIMLVEKILSRLEYTIIQNFINGILATKKKCSKILRFYPETWADINGGSVMDDRWFNYFYLITIKGDCPKLVEFILENFKYFTNAKNDLINAREDRKDTMLQEVIRFERLETALTLLEYGVKVNDEVKYYENPCTYLHLSSGDKKLNPISLKLLEKGANDQILDSNNESAWDLASRGNWYLFFDAFEFYKDNKDFIRKWGTRIFCNAIRENRTDVALQLALNGGFDLEDEQKNDHYEYDNWNLMKMLVKTNQKNGKDGEEREGENHPQKFIKFLRMNDVWSYIIESCHVKLSEEEPTFLHFAIAQRKTDIAEKLILNGADVNALDRHKQTPIYIAAIHQCDWDFIFKWFHKINLNILMGYFNNNLLHLACEQNQLRIVEEIIKTKEADLNCKDFFERTPLLLAAERARWEIVSALLEANVDVNIPDTRGNIALHYACRSNNQKVALALLETNVSSYNANDALLFAALNRHWDLVYNLIKSPSFKVDYSYNDGAKTLLHYACQDKQRDLALEIIEKNKANINCLDYDENTPVLLAALKGHWDLVKELIKINDLDVNKPNKFQKTLLYLACECNEVEVVLELEKKLVLLLGEKANKISDECIDNLLCTACENNRSDLALKVIENRANINCFRKIDKNPVLLAAERNHWDLVSNLIEKFKDQGLKTSIDCIISLLRYACKDNQLDLVLKLIRIGIDCLNNSEKISSSSNFSFLYPEQGAVENVYGDLIDWLITNCFQYEKIITNRFDLKLSNKDGETLLQIACKNNKKNMVLKLPNQAILFKTDRYDRCLVLLAAKYNHWDFIKEAMNLAGFDSDSSCKHKTEIFYLACAKNKVDIALKLRNKGVTFSNDTLSCELRKTAKRGDWDIFTKLATPEAIDVHTFNGRKETLLRFACRDNKIDLALKFVKNGADKNIVDMRGDTPLLCAARIGNFDLVTKLLKFDGFDVNIPNKHGKTLLHFACENDRIDLALKLIEKGAGKNVPDLNGDTPLICAARSGNFDLVTELLTFDDFNANIANKYGKTLLHFACQKNQVDLALRLINEDSINAHDIEGNNAILLAAGNGHWDLVSKLIELHASVNVVNIFKENLLHLACRHNEKEITFDLIQSHTFDINFVNSYERTPIYFAAEYGHWDLVQELIELDGDPTIPDKDKTTVLHFACRDNQKDIAIMLIKERGCDPNATDIFGISPLSLAKRNGYEDLVNEISNLLHPITALSIVNNIFIQ